MYQRLPDANAALRPAVSICIDGKPFIAREGDTVAAALLAAGKSAFRSTPISGAPRGPFCMMGACFDCVVAIDGRPNRQACRERVAAGMIVERGKGARELPVDADPAARHGMPSSGRSQVPHRDPSALPDSCELVVVGAGPAGMAAATLGAELGIDVALLDEQSEPGGQIYRGIANSDATQREILGAEYARGASLLAALSRSSARPVAGASVWSISRDDQGFEIGVSHGDAARLLHAKQVILATGALERPLPIPGWTLPGVMTAGAAQILLKTSSFKPSGRIVIAGCGPLLYLIAWQLLRADVEIEAILDTMERRRLLRALPHVWGFARSAYYARGAKLLQDVNERVTIVHGVTALVALGHASLASVRFTVDGSTKTVIADHLFLHQGVVPDIQLSSAIGCEHEWDQELICWKPRADAWGATTIENVSIAGDSAGIAGALAAEHRGRLAALAVAMKLGRIDAPTRDRLASEHRAALKRALSGRRFVDTLYRPPARFRVAAGDTIVCRCEEIHADEVIAAARAGCVGPNQMKAFLRCGMGPCQGRFCALTVAELIARARGIGVKDVGYARARFPVKPLTLGMLASLPASGADVQAVERLPDDGNAM